MTGEPVYLVDVFAGVMAAVSVYCAARLVAARRWHRHIRVDINVAHVAMGVAMAGMLVSPLDVVPHGWWEAVFVVLGAWFAWRSVRFVVRGVGDGGDRDLHHVSHDLTHLVMAGGMLYMYLGPGAAGSGAMAMGAGTGAQVLVPLACIGALAVSAVWHVDDLSRARAFASLGAVSGTGAAQGPVAGAMGAGPGAPALAPRLESLCHVAMCVTMGFMLVLVL